MKNFRVASIFLIILGLIFSIRGLINARDVKNELSIDKKLEGLEGQNSFYAGITFLALGAILFTVKID